MQVNFSASRGLGLRQGHNLQAILDACAAGRLPATSPPSCPTRPKPTPSCGPVPPDPAVHVGRHAGEPRADYDARLADVVAGFAPDVVVLAGWMRILTMSFLGWFPGRVINLHPALPGELPGTHAIERAWHEALAGERTATGVMVHLVPAEGVDDGPCSPPTTVPSGPTTPSSAHRPRARAPSTAAHRHPRPPLPTGGPQ